MVRFIASAVLLATLACSSLAFPHNHDKGTDGGSAPLVMLPPTGGEAGDSKFFFFPFNFWNGFKPLPWIPLPGIALPTTQPPAGNEDGGDDNGDDAGDEDGGDDAGDEDGGDDAGDEDGDAEEE
ncbi:hypothetical protein Ocin01_01251 [Orchesella cincta]|uniref:Uncharacterized protein n=1 Tax=Orchesella cincta TaxID=48709 RepID=A0A1D2NJF0_ORCCI|nr:hypothetical protein Ocin01_01251 [Orchesella cincta]